MPKIRSILFTAYMAVMALLIGTLGCWSLLRQDWALKVSKLWARTLLFGLRWICGIRHKITEASGPVPSPALIAAKHQSMWETIFLTTHFDKPCFILKQELRSIPIFGWWCARSGFIFVDRLAGAKALRTMVSDARAALERGVTHLIIFPEGTRMAPGASGLYQPGVAALAKAVDLPVVPTAHNSGLYWRHKSGGMVPGTVNITFLKPIPSDCPRAKLMAELQLAVEERTRALEEDARSSGAPPLPAEETRSHV